MGKSENPVLLITPVRPGRHQSSMRPDIRISPHGSMRVHAEAIQCVHSQSTSGRTPQINNSNFSLTFRNPADSIVHVWYDSMYALSRVVAFLGDFSGGGLDKHIELHLHTSAPEFLFANNFKNDPNNTTQNS